MEVHVVTILLFLLLGKCAAQEKCPYLFKHIFESYTPLGNLSKTTFTEYPQLTDQWDCVKACCAKANCNVVFIHNFTCYHVQCTTSEMCLPLYRPEFVDGNPPRMILVNPVNESNTWKNVISRINANAQYVANIYQFVNNRE